MREPVHKWTVDVPDSVWRQMTMLKKSGKGDYRNLFLTGLKVAYGIVPLGDMQSSASEPTVEPVAPESAPAASPVRSSEPLSRAVPKPGKR